MHRSVKSALARAQGLWVALALAGCDNAFVPPPQAELSELRERRPAARTVEICLSNEHTWDRDLLEQVAREQAGLAHVFFQVHKVSPREPAEQANWVRGAKARGASALIVEPLGGEELARALGQVRDEGIPVVLIGRSVPTGSKPFPVVTHPSFTGPARDLVQAAVDAARAAKLPEDGGAVLLVNTYKDDQSDERVAELRAALQGVNVPLLATISFEAGGAAAQKAAEDALKAHPKLSIILAEEDQGLIGAAQTRDARKDAPRFILCGVLAATKDMGPNVLTLCDAYVDRNTKQLGSKAFQAALALTDGKPVPDRIEVPYEFERNPAPEVLVPGKMDKGVKLRGE